MNYTVIVIWGLAPKWPIFTFPVKMGRWRTAVILRYRVDVFGLVTQALTPTVLEVTGGVFPPPPPPKMACICLGLRVKEAIVVFFNFKDLFWGFLFVVFIVWLFRLRECSIIDRVVI